MPFTVYHNRSPFVDALLAFEAGRGGANRQTDIIESEMDFRVGQQAARQFGTSFGQGFGGVRSSGLQSQRDEAAGERQQQREQDRRDRESIKAAGKTDAEIKAAAGGKSGGKGDGKGGGKGDGKAGGKGDGKAGGKSSTAAAKQQGAAKTQPSGIASTTQPSTISSFNMGDARVQAILDFQEQQGRTAAQAEFERRRAQRVAQETQLLEQEVDQFMQSANFEKQIPPQNRAEMEKVWAGVTDAMGDPSLTMDDLGKVLDIAQEKVARLSIPSYGPRVTPLSIQEIEQSRGLGPMEGFDAYLTLDPKGNPKPVTLHRTPAAVGPNGHQIGETWEQGGLILNRNSKGDTVKLGEVKGADGGGADFKDLWRQAIAAGKADPRTGMKPSPDEVIGEVLQALDNTRDVQDTQETRIRERKIAQGQQMLSRNAMPPPEDLVPGAKYRIPTSEGILEATWTGSEWFDAHPVIRNELGEFIRQIEQDREPAGTP